MRPLVLALMLLPLPAIAADLPDPVLTPGAINPDVTQDNIAGTICKRGWTATIRPPVSYTNRLKRSQLPAGEIPRDYEEDHRVPLECGGHPTDPRNLSPEPWDGAFGAHAKDRLENAARRDVCAGRITLEDCQAIFMGDWRGEYQRRFGP